MLDRVEAYRLVQPAMMLQVSLLIPGKVQRAQPDIPLDR